MKFQLQIDDQSFSYEIEGNFIYGGDELLIEKDKNAIASVSWRDKGYTVYDLFTPKAFQELRYSLTGILNDILSSLGLEKLKQLEDYHLIVNTIELHQQVIQKTRALTKKHFAINLEAICERISALLDQKVEIFNPKLDVEIITLRISRPNSLDINPMHRDGYLDIYKNTVNLWIPIAGCNKKSSLPVVPGSHYWNEKEILRTKPGEAEINGLKYHVPGIIKGPQPLHAIRPNPKYGQALIFSPYLIHGSAINMNEDITRMALELRPCLVKTKS